MNLTAQQKRICEQVVNVFETGSLQGDYSAIARFDDGPHRIRQVTYGRSQTTEYGKLHDLVEQYVESNGSLSDKLKPFVDKIGHTPLVDDDKFLNLLREAGKDPVMQQVQDEFFYEHYFMPAMAWAGANGFSLALSALVIYDSFIHSGSIPGFLRKLFPAETPSNGGDEKSWITEYVEARDGWLRNHSNLLLRKTVYRTECFQCEIKRSNWNLLTLPIDAHGTWVSGA
jgi:chitosanase